MIPPRMERALSKLVRAYFNGTLRKGDCHACAVGNMCDGRSEWSYVFMTAMGEQRLYPGHYSGSQKNIIDQTGYTWQELARVEFAFESNTRIDPRTSQYTPEQLDQDQYNGLMAVVDVLCDIEGITETSDIRKRFDKSTNLIPVEV